MREEKMERKVVMDNKSLRLSSFSLSLPHVTQYCAALGIYLLSPVIN